MRPGPDDRAVEELASRHFARCATHAAEATEVFVALERLAGSKRGPLDPDVPLRDLIPEPPSAEDSLEAVERELAIDEPMMAALLGPAAAGCAWDPATIWSRSARGVINERVRVHGGCSCG